MRIEFTVQDIPPKKDGANSMWSKDSEVPRIISLRKAALEAMKKAGLKTCISSPVKLELTVFASSSQLEFRSGSYIGDLDTFITGVCDGLQAAHENIKVTHPLLQDPQYREIVPKRYLLLDDDSRVMSIVASKVPIDDRQQPYYQITIEPI